MEEINEINLELETSIIVLKVSILKEEMVEGEIKEVEYYEYLTELRNNVINSGSLENAIHFKRATTAKNIVNHIKESKLTHYNNYKIKDIKIESWEKKSEK